MNKRIRDRAISSSPSIMTGTYKGEDWHTDSFIATKYPILEGYRLRKHQVELSNKPEIDKIIDNGKTYSLAEFQEANKEEDGITYLWSTANDIKVKLATRYVELVRNIYPEAIPFVAIDIRLAPVKFYNGGEIVAVVMPIR